MKHSREITLSNDEQINVDFWFEPIVQPSHNEPGEHEVLELLKVTHRGVDITSFVEGMEIEAEILELIS